MSKIPSPSVYVLGGTPELDMTFTDINGDPFLPIEVRLSIKEPSGTILTYSGGSSDPGTDIIEASGYLYFLYRPPTKGWYEYEGWGKDGTGREITQTNGFEVIDHIY